jgi:hypothetical protein
MCVPSYNGAYSKQKPVLRLVEGITGLLSVKSNAMQLPNKPRVGLEASPESNDDDYTATKRPMDD